MRFEITRASGTNEEVAPYEKAYRVTHFSKLRSPYDVWAVDVNTLEDLVEIMQKTGEEIILSLRREMPYLKIYDDFI